MLTVKNAIDSEANQRGLADRKVCPECGHVFQGNGWDGIDAHWKAKHGKVMPYDEAWPLLKAGTYEAKARDRRAADTAQIGGEHRSMKGPKTAKAVETVKAVVPLAETTPQKAEAGRAMDQVGRIEGLSQAEKFAQAARDLGADQDEDAFKGVLRKLTKTKP